MKELPLNALRAYAAVYDSGGIRPASRILDVTHSTVSRHVSELEAWINAPLITSGANRRISFTASGERLGRIARDCFGDLSNAVTAIREAKGPNSIVISTTASVAIRWLLPRLPKLAQSHPRLIVSVLTEQALVAPDGVSVDLAIRMGSGPWADSNAIRLMDDALFPVCHPAFAEDKVGRSDEDIIAAGPLLHDRDPSTAWSRWFAKYPDARVNMSSGGRFASSDLLLRAAMGKLGVALARSRLVNDDIASGALRRLCVDRQIDIPSAYWIVLPPEKIGRRQSVMQTVEWLLASTE